jgi:hypothetical protein
MFPLYLCAHKKEADAFFNRFSYTKLDQELPWLYYGPNHYLLVTGENTIDLIFRLSIVLQNFRSSLSQLINFGIAGGISTLPQRNVVYSIRTVYGEKIPGSYHFQSYPLNAQGQYDCVTACERITNTTRAKTLQPVADLVDMELWYVANIANRFKLPVKSFKIVSDYPCLEDDIFDWQQIPELSKLLFDAIANLKDMDGIEIPSVFNLQELRPYSFSASQQKLFEGYLQTLKIRTGKNEKAILRDLQSAQLADQIHSPKKRAAALLEKIAALVNAQRIDVQKRLEDYLSSIAYDDKMAMIPDRNLESELLEVRLRISGQDDIENACSRLRRLDMTQLQRILDGEE